MAHGVSHPFDARGRCFLSFCVDLVSYGRGVLSCDLKINVDIAVGTCDHINLREMTERLAKQSKSVRSSSRKSIKPSSGELQTYFAA